MKIIVRTKEVNFRMPVPVRLAGFAVKRMPESLFLKMQAEVPKPYDQLVTKESISMIVEECLDVFKENKGLEIIHVEAADGTYVSITL